MAFALVVALGASLLATSPALAQTEPPSSQGPPAHALDRAHNGQGAINALGDRLPEVADAHGMHPNDLARSFREDLTLWVDPTLRLFYVEPAGEADVHGAAAHGEQEHADEGSGEPAVEGAAPYPLENTFLLESRPGSQRTIFLDFDGHTVTGTGWNNSTDFGTGDTIEADAYDIDSDPTTFSTAERENIQDVWRRVAEDFAPFDVNVTTEDPGYAAINRSGSSDAVFGTRLLVDGGTPALSCGCGGIAYVGVFQRTTSHDYYQPAWVFQQSTASPKSIAEAASHEVGHNLNLNHDGMGTASYYEGHDAWAPIMGVGYYRPITQWSKGEYTGATNQQDDLSVMASYGLPLMADDHGDTNAAATVLGSGPDLLTASGLVSTAADVDVFSFESVGGVETIAVDPAAVSPDLDVSLTLHDSNGLLVAADDAPSAYSTKDVATGVAAGLELEVLAGTYYVHVDGTGVGDVLGTGYSDYGSLGHYTVTVQGTAPAVDAAPAASLDSPIEGATVRGVIDLTATVTDDVGVDSVEFLVDGVSVGVGTPGAGDTWTRSWNTAGVADGQSHVVSVVATDSSAQTTSDASTVTVLSGAVVDFDGDGRTDLGVFRPSIGRWWVLSAATETVVVNRSWGAEGDVPLTGDFDGDGRTDLGVFRPSIGRWWVLSAATETVVVNRSWGAEGDVPLTGDFDGDGRTDLGLFRPSIGRWWVLSVATETIIVNRSWGADGDVPLTGDYNGDGVADLGLFRPSTGRWYAYDAVAGSIIVNRSWGAEGDVPLTGDFDGDGRTDLGLFRPSIGRWWVLSVATETIIVNRSWGADGDVPLTGDYNGDGVADLGLFRPSTGRWYAYDAVAGSIIVNRSWGAEADVALD